MRQDLLNHINSTIVKQAAKLIYTVNDSAPNTDNALFSSTGLVIWSGASDNTIFQDKAVNWAFRALHDALHLVTGLGFSPEQEVLLGRIQAANYTGIIADLVYIEVAGQAEHFLKTGSFVSDQVTFTVDALKHMGYKL